VHTQRNRRLTGLLYYKKGRELNEGRPYRIKRWKEPELKECLRDEEKRTPKKHASKGINPRRCPLTTLNRGPVEARLVELRQINKKETKQKVAKGGTTGGLASNPDETT